MLYMDFWGLIVWNGYEYTIMTMIDHFLKWAETMVVPDRQASTVITTLVSEWVTWFGLPLAIVSDNAKEFVSDVINKVCAIIGTNKLEITAYYCTSACVGILYQRKRRYIQIAISRRRFYRHPYTGYCTITGTPIPNIVLNQARLYRKLFWYSHPYTTNSYWD